MHARTHARAEVVARLAAAGGVADVAPVAAQCSVAGSVAGSLAGSGLAGGYGGDVLELSITARDARGQPCEAGGLPFAVRLEGSFGAPVEVRRAARAHTHADTHTQT